MKINILHLYDKSMNLYGEYANILVLSKYLTDMGYETVIDTLNLCDNQTKLNNKDISAYDFYYMGSGTEKAAFAVIKDLSRFKPQLLKAMKENRPMLFTGNAFDILGSSITDADNNVQEALSFFEFNTTLLNKRITGDCIAEAAFLSSPVVGFINKCSKTTGIETPLFKLLMGSGNDNTGEAEGFVHEKTFATHITGPIMVRNPHFMRFIAQNILERLGESINNEIQYSSQEKAYSICVHELRNRLEEK